MSLAAPPKGGRQGVLFHRSSFTEAFLSPSPNFTGTPIRIVEYPIFNNRTRLLIMNSIPNDYLKQFVLLIFILALGITLGWQLYAFFPGILGAITLYILMREHYFHLAVIRNWPKWLSAMIFILGSIIIFVLPLAFLAQILIPKFSQFFSDTRQLNNILTALAHKLQSLSPHLSISDEEIRSLIQRLTTALPSMLGATLNMLTNAILAFFILYFMLVDGRKMENTIQKYIPLRHSNIHEIWTATRIMVVSNAVGIPILAACQALVAILGYYLFGIDSFILWGIITGIFSLVPIVGTAIIWIPLVVFLFGNGQVAEGTGLLLYSLVITGGVDNVLRFTILKKLGDVHPIVTTLGILVGVPLFGFMGFIFGPLLISYLLLMIKIYRKEFAPKGE